MSRNNNPVQNAYLTYVYQVSILMSMFVLSTLIDILHFDNSPSNIDTLNIDSSYELSNLINSLFKLFSSSDDRRNILKISLIVSIFVFLCCWFVTEHNIMLSLLFFQNISQ